MIGMDCVNQQARRDLISRLSDLRSQYNLFDEGEQGAYHTLTEAIAVLNWLPSAQPTQPNTPNTLKALDCISRQDAIDAARNWYEGLICGSFKGLEKQLQALPPAQPDIIRCKDCKHNPNEEWCGCPMSHLSETQRPDDAWCWKGERRTDE